MWSEAIKNRFAFQKIFNYFGVSQKTSVDFSLIFFANLVNNGTNFIANILIARMFGHEIFGLFSIAMNIAFTTLTFSEFGMNLTMVRLYKLHEQDLQKSNAVLIWNLYFKLMILSLLAMIAIFFSIPLSKMLTQSADNSILVAIALICGGLLGFFSYLKALFQSFNLFKNIAYIILAYAFLRLAFLFFYIGFTIPANVEVLFTGIYLLPVLSLLLLGFYFQRDKLIIKGIGLKALDESGKEIVNYSKWVAISLIAGVLIHKGIFFIAAFYTDIKQVSILSAGIVFAGFFSLINDAMRQLLLPKVTQLAIDRISEYRKKLIKMLPFYLLISFLIILFFSLLMHFTLGENYKDSLPIFWIIGASIALTSGLGFYNILFHAIMKPKPDTFANIGTALSIIVVSLLVVKAYGLMGIVISYASILFIGEIIKTYLLIRTLKNYSK